MEHVPHVSPINVQELLDFCEDSGYKCRLEPRGTLLLPPDYNIGMTDWERSLRLRWAPCTPVPSLGLLLMSRRVSAALHARVSYPACLTASAAVVDSPADARARPHCRKGRYSVLDSEPEPSAPANPGDAPAEDVICVDDTAPTLHNNAVGPPPTDIEDWRARLERQWQ